jgi:hypothetical protein
MRKRNVALKIRRTEMQNKAGLLALSAMLLSISTARGAGQVMVILNLETGKIEKTLPMPQGHPATGASMVGSPCWSHDGKKLVYDATAEAQIGIAMAIEWHIFVQDLESDDRPRDLGPGDTPMFTLDDKQIMFNNCERDEGHPQPAIYIMNLDGEGRQYVTSGRRPRMSRDGTRIAFIETENDESFLVVYTMADCTKFRVAKAGGDIPAPDWSPQGDRIVFKGEHGIHIVSAKKDADDSHSIWPDTGWQLAWGAKEEIYAPLGSTIRRFDAGATTVQNPVVVEGQEPGIISADCAVSLDGKRLAYASSQPAE